MLGVVCLCVCFVGRVLWLAGARFPVFIYPQCSVWKEFLCVAGLGLALLFTLGWNLTVVLRHSFPASRSIFLHAVMRAGSLVCRKFVLRVHISPVGGISTRARICVALTAQCSEISSTPPVHCSVIVGFTLWSEIVCQIDVKDAHWLVQIRPSRLAPFRQAVALSANNLCVNKSRADPRHGPGSVDAPGGKRPRDVRTPVTVPRGKAHDASCVFFISLFFFFFTSSS